MKLSELLDSQLIFTELESLEKERFLREIISRISDVQSSIKESTVIDLILKREKLCSTALDNFIAIPHAKIPGIDKTYISLCISNNGIDFGSIDGLKTKILILILHPEEFPRVYNSTWVKRYYKEKVKLQWATVLKKYSGMTLPGGVQLDGNAMAQEAEQEIEKLFNALLTDYAEPLNFFIG